jgi:hypothetical protein
MIRADLYEKRYSIIAYNISLTQDAADADDGEDVLAAKWPRNVKTSLIN